MQYAWGSKKKKHNHQNMKHESNNLLVDCLSSRNRARQAHQPAFPTKPNVWDRTSCLGWRAKCTRTLWGMKRIRHEKQNFITLTLAFFHPTLSNSFMSKLLGLLLSETAYCDKHNDSWHTWRLSCYPWAWGIQFWCQVLWSKSSSRFLLLLGSVDRRGPWSQAWNLEVKRSTGCFFSIMQPLLCRLVNKRRYIFTHEHLDIQTDRNIQTDRWTHCTCFVYVLPL